jgi:hypothetical protein
MKSFQCLEELSDQEIKIRLEEALNKLCAMQMFLDRHEDEMEQADIKAILCEFRHQSNVYKELRQQNLFRSRQILK